MQASKILPGAIYAIKQGEEHKRFHVHAVVTRRSKNTGSPHDYESHVEGYVLEDHEPGERKLVRMDPKKLLGEFTEFSELVERKRLEEAAAKEKGNAEKAALERLATLLYRAAGLPVPEKLDKYRVPIRTAFGSIDIGGEAIPALTSYLEANDERLRANGTEGQDRESYSDEQDRDSYT